MRKMARVTIRPLTPGDLAAFQAYRSDPDVARYQSWEPMSDEEAKGFIEDVKTTTGLIPGRWIQLGVADETGLIGDLGLRLEADETEAEIGFTLAAAAQGRGLGSEAVRGALGLIFQTTPVDRVIGVTDAENTPSLRLMERMGFEKVAEEETVFRGEPCVEFTYEMTRTRAAALKLF